MSSRPENPGRGRDLASPRRGLVPCVSAFPRAHDVEEPHLLGNDPAALEALRGLWPLAFAQQ